MKICTIYRKEVLPYINKTEIFLNEMKGLLTFQG